MKTYPWLWKWLITPMVAYLYFDFMSSKFGNYRLWPLAVIATVATFVVLKMLEPRAPKGKIKHDDTHK